MADEKHKRIQLSFVKGNKEHMDIYEKLERLGKAKTKVVVMALKEFFDTYNLHDKDADEIKKFIEIYPYLSGIKNKAAFTGIDFSGFPVEKKDKNKEPVKKKEEESLSAGPKVSNEAKNSMSNLLSKFSI